MSTASPFGNEHNFGPRGPGGPVSETDPRPHFSWPPTSEAALRAVGVIALIAAAVTAGQALHVVITGKELCVGQGCALVGSLTRVSPALFNLFGAAVFSLAAGLAFLARRRKGPLLAWALHVLLVGALGAEGVLFAYQWHVAGAWCIYCLVILAVVATLNLVCSPRGAVYGLSAFAATLTIFSLLSFIPFNKTLDDGTLAVQQSPGSPELYLIFSENCPHCQRVLGALQEGDRCTVRYNPVAEMPPTVLPNLEKIADYDPRVNVAAATMLGLRSIPILVAREPGGLRLVHGEASILRYVEENCSEPAASDPILQPWRGGSLLAPGDDGCGFDPDCE